MRRLFRLLRARSGLEPPTRSVIAKIERINARRAELSRITDNALKAAGRGAENVLEEIAVTAEGARRTVGLDLFDVQVRGALALANGRIAEMQTGEGKTLAAVPAIVRYARQNQGVHVMTANDYLARRDIQCLSPIYSFLGLTAGCIQQRMTGEQRWQAYACNITYATANEVGFDYLRDQFALQPSQLVQRPLAAAVIDEADSIPIDEARIPLVVAGGTTSQDALAYRVDEITRRFRPILDYTVDGRGQNVSLTEEGIAAAERAIGCGNLFEESNLSVHAAVQNSLHAHVLLRHDVDYLVKDDGIESIDEFKGRVAQERRCRRPSKPRNE